MSVPCARCIGCRTDRASEWARRCVHEAAEWDKNCFLTLTYSESHLPRLGHLVPTDLQLFFKRLRQFTVRHPDIIAGDRSKGIRFFACGEYGDIRDRPHYHALLFNCFFNDQVRVGEALFESPSVSSLWEFGKHRIGECNVRSANYVAQYSLKKQYGAAAMEDTDVDFETGEVVVRPQPFLRMSLRPGIGAGWLSRFAGDLSQGYLVVDGKKCRIPRAYVERLSRNVECGGNPQMAELIVQRRYEAFMRDFKVVPNLEARLAAGEEIHHARKNLYNSRSL